MAQDVLDHRPAALRRAGMLVLLAAAGLVLFAATTSGQVLERALVPEGSRSLSWGPALFRELLLLHGVALGIVAWLQLGRAPGRNSTEAVGRIDLQSEAGRGGALVPGALAGLLVLALGLRLWRLETCLWLDEVLTLVRFARPSLATIVTSFPDQNQHMLYSVLAHLSLGFFGESAWALRLPAVAFGVASIWALYMLGRMIASRGEAVAAAALLTVSYHHVWFSQNARGYSGLLLFTLVGTWLFLRAMRERRWSTWIWYAVSLALGMWVHITMAFVIASHVLIYAWLLASSLLRADAGGDGVPPSVCLRPVLALVLGATLTAQLYALVLPEFLRSAAHEVSLRSEWTSPLWVLRETLANLRIGFAGVVGLAAAAALFLAGLVSFGRSNRMFVALLVLPGLLGGGSMVVLGHNLWPRFFFYTVGYALLIAVRGAMVWGEIAACVIRDAAARPAVARHLGTAAVLLMMAASAVSLPRCYRLPKQDYLGAKAYVQAHCRPNDAVVTAGLAAIPYAWYYAPAWTTVETADELAAVRDEAEVTWLVYSFPTHMESYCTEIWRVVQQDFEVVQVFPGTLGGGNVFVCRSRPGTAQRG